MAYESNRLKHGSAGHGEAPAVFTYRTDDSIADVTTENYFKDAVAIFQPNDFIYANVNTNADMAFLICVQSTKADGGNQVVDFSTTGTFVGDVRATDEAGYQSNNFGGNIGAGGPMAFYTYRNNTDDTATITGADYFLEAGLFLRVGDIIHCVSNDGAFLARVLTTGTGGVTTEEIAFV